MQMNELNENWMNKLNEYYVEELRRQIVVKVKFDGNHRWHSWFSAQFFTID